MRVVNVIYFVFIFYNFVLSQELKTYHFTVGQILDEYSISGGTTGNKRLVKDSYRFTLETLIPRADVGVNDKLIWILGFNGDFEYDGILGSDLNPKYFKNSSDEPIYFLVPADVWDDYVEEVYKDEGIMFGVSSVPIKVRFGSNNPEKPNRFIELDANVNLGLSIAYYWKRGDNQLLLINAGISISQYKVDQINTNSYVDQIENHGGFGIFAGVIYQKDAYQIGLLIGLDYVTGELSRHWVYQGKPWLGVGIGISIFQPNKTPETRQSTS